MRLSAETLNYGRRAAGALLGVDSLYRAESGDETGLVVLNMARPGELEAATFDSYAAAEEAWRALRREAADLSEPDRELYYDQLARSTLAFISWRSTGLSFKSQVVDFLHLPASAASDSELEAIRSGLRALLGQLGYHGELDVQCAVWEERNRVSSGEVETIMAGLLSEAWDRTEAFVCQIPAEKSDGMSVKAVRGTPFNARCDYANRTIEINVDPVLTLPGLRHLAVHEGCPGHYLQFKLRETAHREGLGAADSLLSVVNSASSSVFEGIGDVALSMIKWDRSEDDRIQSLLNRYRSGIGTGAAWRLHAEGWPERRVKEWLRKQTLVGGDGWVENRMRFIADSARAVLIWSYWAGEPAVSVAWDKVPPSRRDDFVSYLYGRMHSTRTVSMFPG